MDNLPLVPEKYLGRTVFVLYLSCAVLGAGCISKVEGVRMKWGKDSKYSPL